ncbi:MAG: helix-turn-helix domain-containing protein [Melioribacteraceae bacterium]|nr:helix-turn-helix domain-containing protein [Melioribacteraceae bacterium]
MNSKYWYGMSDPAIIEVMGNFVKKTRLNQNRTQQALSEAAGINRSTLVQLEKGKGGTLLSLIQILRALGQLHLFEIFEIKQELSPLQLAEIEMKKRRRASKDISQNNKPKSAW